MVAIEPWAKAGVENNERHEIGKHAQKIGSARASWERARIKGAANLAGHGRVYLARLASDASGKSV